MSSALPYSTAGGDRLSRSWGVKAGMGMEVSVGLVHMESGCRTRLLCGEAGVLGPQEG